MSEENLLACFRMPAALEITGRASTMRNVFVGAIMPVVRPTVDEIRTVLGILEMDPLDLRCAYCGDHATEWDHLRPLVAHGKPTGYPSSIKNLVPACSKCNQSKGKRDWKEWMTSTAPRSPATRGRLDMEQRSHRLEAFEAWANCNPLDVEKMVDPMLWQKYFEAQEGILSQMRQAQELSHQLRAQIATALETLPSSNS